MKRILRAGAGRSFEALKSKDFRRFYIADLGSICGWWAQVVAQSWVVFSLDSGSVGLGGFYAFRFGPLFVVGILAGTVIDRYDRRKLMKSTLIVDATTATVGALLVATHHISLPLMYLMATVDGTSAAFSRPARSTFVYEVVGPDKIHNAVGLLTASANMGRIVGPPIAAVLISASSAAWCYLLNAATFVIAYFIVRTIKADLTHATPLATREHGQFMTGLRYALGHRHVFAPLVTVLLVGTFAYNFSTTVPVIATREFHGGAATISLLMTSFGVGGLIGSLAVASVGATKHPVLWVMCAAFAAALSAVALAPNTTAACVALFFTGIASVVYTTRAMAALQQATEPYMRGRVISMWNMALLGTTPVGAPAVGYLAQWYSPSAAFTAGAAACLLAALCAAFLDRPDAEVSRESNNQLS